MKIEHIALFVNDLEKEKDFFVRYFNGVSGNYYKNLNTGFCSYFISFSDGARLELMNDPKISAGGGKPLLGYSHLAFSVSSRERVDSLTEELRRDGYIILSCPRLTGDGYYESCVADSEGNRIEITV